MDNQPIPNWFHDIDTIVSEPLNFKASLAIGEDAFALLKVKNAVVQAWDVAGVATTAAVVTKSSVVASTFFAPTGFLAAIGIGTAVTPIGWVIAASVVTGGAWMGITRYLKKASANRVTVIPNFINTPLDVLALGLFDMLAPLALKIAEFEGYIDGPDRKLINDYFVKEWGYDPKFVVEGIRYTESKLAEFSIRELAQTLVEFTSGNPDCNFKLMSQEILGFLQKIIEGSASLDVGENLTIKYVATIFNTAQKPSLKRKLMSSWGFIRQKTSKFFPSSKSTNSAEKP